MDDKVQENIQEDNEGDGTTSNLKNNQAHHVPKRKVVNQNNEVHEAEDHSNNLKVTYKEIQVENQGIDIDIQAVTNDNANYPRDIQKKVKNCKYRRIMVCIVY